MEKLFLTLAILLIASIAHGACVCEDDMNRRPHGLGGGTHRLIFTCTADATPATCSSTIDSDVMREISGMYLYTVTTRPGGTAPTDATDLAITDSIEKSYLDASGNGLNLIDATSTLWDFPDGGVGSENFYPIIHGDRPLTFTITNQAVNNAIMIIEFELIK